MHNNISIQWRLHNIKYRHTVGVRSCVKYNGQEDLASLKLNSHSIKLQNIAIHRSFQLFTKRIRLL